MLTEKENKYCSEITDRVSRMRKFLDKNFLAQPPEPTAWNAFFSELRKIQGNPNNDGSFVATLLAKRYLCSKFKVDFDAAEKAQGAPGMDIDITTSKGCRIVAEIKTTVPYLGLDFGAQQASSFKRDFKKLVTAKASYKFLFVTDSGAFSALKKEKYTKLMHGVRIVNLTTSDEYGA